MAMFLYSKLYNVTFFPSHEAHAAALISVSLTLSSSARHQFTLQDTDTGLVRREVSLCLFTFQFLLIFIALTHGVEWPDSVDLNGQVNLCLIFNSASA